MPLDQPIQYIRSLLKLGCWTHSGWYLHRITAIRFCADLYILWREHVRLAKETNPSFTPSDNRAIFFERSKCEASGKNFLHPHWTECEIFKTPQKYLYSIFKVSKPKTFDAKNIEVIYLVQLRHEHRVGWPLVATRRVAKTWWELHVEIQTPNTIVSQTPKLSLKPQICETSGTVVSPAFTSFRRCFTGWQSSSSWKKAWNGTSGLAICSLQNTQPQQVQPSFCHKISYQVLFPNPHPNKTIQMVFPNTHFSISIFSIIIVFLSKISGFFQPNGAFPRKNHRVAAPKSSSPQVTTRPSPRTAAKAPKEGQICCTSSSCSSC